MIIGRSKSHVIVCVMVARGLRFLFFSFYIGTRFGCSEKFDGVVTSYLYMMFFVLFLFSDFNLYDF